MKRLLALAALLSLAALPACSNVKRELGVGRNSPDEFAVVKRAPLTLPPDYDLRPPASQGAAPAADSAAAARTAVMGESAAPSASASGESALLAKMGAQAARPDIRAQIDADNGAIALQNQSVKDKLIFWKEPSDAPPADAKLPDSTVDPKAEAARLKKNKDEGKPVNDGKVPVIEKKPSTMDRLFQ